jgi:hypothetical protein
MPGKRLPVKITLDRRAHAKRIFLDLCDQFGVRPNGWGNPEDMLSGGGAFRNVWWNHQNRTFWVQPHFETHRRLVDPSAIFSDERECYDGYMNWEGWVLDEHWTDDGVPMLGFGSFVSPGFTYDLMSSDVM